MDFEVDYELEGEWSRTFAVLMRGRTTGVGGSPRPSQPQIQPTHQRRQDQDNGEQRIACRILIQNEQLEQVGTSSYIGSLITDVECTTEFRTRLIRGQAIRAFLQKMWKSHCIPISTKL